MIHYSLASFTCRFRIAQIVWPTVLFLDPEWELSFGVGPELMLEVSLGLRSFRGSFHHFFDAQDCFLHRLHERLFQFSKWDLAATPISSGPISGAGLSRAPIGIGNQFAHRNAAAGRNLRCHLNLGANRKQISSVRRLFSRSEFPKAAPRFEHTS